MNKLVFASPRALKLVLIVLPLLLYGVYLLAIAAPRYVSESIVTVRQDNGDASALPGAALMLAGISSTSSLDTLQVREFIQSQDLLLALDQRLDLRKHFAQAGMDLPFRLPEDASLEDFTLYYRDRVETHVDDRSALLTLRVQAFSAEFAEQLNAAILKDSERFVNESSHRIARERLRFAEGELTLAGTRLQQARADVLAFQSKHRLLDPTAQAQASEALTAELESARAKLEAELGGLRGFLNDDAYQIVALRGQIAALNKQIAEERSRATQVQGKQGARLSQLAIEFQGLQLQAEFARDAYKLALAAVENARIDATRKIKSLVVIESSTRPETAEYPRIGYNFATLLVLCLLLYAIARLALATIREHQE